jgi:hypothetical protein
MNSPGIKSLGDIAITAAGAYVSDVVSGLEGALAIAAQMRLAYGSGSGTVKGYLQTSLDQGTSWIDVACFTFTVGAVKVRNLSALTPKTTDVVPTDGALADDSSVDGVLGDRFRVKAVTTGTYANTVLSSRINVR